MCPRSTVAFALLVAAVVASACTGEDVVAPAGGSSSGTSGSPNDGGPSSSSGGDAGNGSACAVACASDETCFEGVCGGDKVKQAASGSTLSCAVRVSGSVSCWGLTAYAALGSRIDTSDVSCGTKPCSPTPRRVPLPTAAESVSVGEGGACVVTRGGDVYCWGRNHAGELGVPLAKSMTCSTQPCVDTPTKVEGLPSGVTHISVGKFGACARTGTGEVWCWGGNDHGQLGNGTTDSSDKPVKVKLPAPASSVSYGADQYGHACAVVAARVYCWGDNVQLNLGHGHDADITCPSTHYCSPTPTEVTTLGSKDIVSVTTGAGHACALDTTNAVYCWGYHGYKAGVTGTEPSTTPRPVLTGARAISGRYAHVCAIRNDATVACWGLSESGRLGFIENDGKAPCVPGVLWTCNDGSPSNVAISEVLAIDAHAPTTLAVVKNGRLLGWGGTNNADLAVAPSAAPSTCPNPEATDSRVACAPVPAEIVLPP